MTRQRFLGDDGHLMSLQASRRLRTALTIVVMILILAIAIGELREIIARLSWADARADFTRVPPMRILLSEGITIASYVVLTGYDVVSLRIIGREMSYRTAALASFTSYIFSHNFGFGALTGGAARLRIYGRNGLTLSDVVQIMATTGVTFRMGILLLLSIGLVAVPRTLAIGARQASYVSQASIGVAIFASLVGYLGVLHRRADRALRVFGRSLVLPSPRTASVQFLLAALNLTLATAALFVLVPGLPWSTFYRC